MIFNSTTSENPLVNSSIYFQRQTRNDIGGEKSQTPKYVKVIFQSGFYVIFDSKKRIIIGDREF